MPRIWLNNYLPTCELGAGKITYSASFHLLMVLSHDGLVSLMGFQVVK